MAKITVLLGELSGSIAGNTFSRNKAGAYVRQKVTPTDPKSEAQMRARSTFANVSAAFHGLTPLRKLQWNEFALSLFKPRDGRIAGVTYTGQQAFVSLNAQLRNAADRESFVNSFSVGGTTASAYANFRNTVLQSPPALTFSGNIRDSGALEPISQILTNVQFTPSANSIHLSFTMGGAGGSTSPISSAPAWVDPVSNTASGYIVFAGDVVEQEGLAPINIHKNLLTVIPPPTTFTGTYAPALTFAIDANVDNSYASRKEWYVAGNTTRVTVYAISSATGQTQLIGSLDVVCS